MSWSSFLNSCFLANPPEVIEGIVVTGHFSVPSTKRKITERLNEILDYYKKFKIGKTSEPKERKDAPDYRKKYKHLIPLYKSQSIDYIKEAEVYYIEKFGHKLDNEKPASYGRMKRDKDGFYYLYVVVN